jgi:hypothetical protein
VNDTNDTREMCPRCGGRLKQFEHDLGALSRSDNETTVCGPCGDDEAMVWNGCEAAIPTLPGWIDARPWLD